MRIFNFLNKPISNLVDDVFFEALRKKEYGRLDRLGHTYLDYTGGNLYAESQIQQHLNLLKNQVFGNPHSTNPSSQFATELVNEARTKVLDFFKAKDYYCIFTSNASQALQIVGENYPFSQDAKYLLLSDNHNSVNGIREYAVNAGADFSYVKLHYEDLSIDADDLNKHLSAHADKKNKLFAYPAQSNVSGIKHALDWIATAKQKGWDVLLDAAAFVPSSPLDLSRVHPDFVSVSFYKIFGYPTGLGCLLVHKSAFPKLKKRWFAGGTVKLVSVKTPHHFLADDHERFENGTVNYLDIPAITTGLNYIENIGIERIRQRVASLMRYLTDGLKDLQHSNGKPIVKLFTPKNPADRGGTLILSFLTRDGQAVFFEKIEAEANKRMISIRSGCFCNPGLDEVYNCVSTESLQDYFSHKKDGNYHDMLAHLKIMRGATRVSVGLATTSSDLNVFIDFVKSLKDRDFIN